MCEKNQLIYILGAILLPKPVFASDPTGLAVIFVSIPTLIIAISIFITCMIKPKIGISLTVLFFIFQTIFFGQIPIDFTPDSVTFIINLAVIINFIGIIIGFYILIEFKNNRKEPAPPGYRWVCMACLEANEGNTSVCKNCNCPSNSSKQEIENMRNKISRH